MDSFRKEKGWFKASIRRLGALGLVLGILAGVPGAARAEEAFGPLTASEQGQVDRGDIVVQVENTSEDLKSFRAVGQIKASAQKVYEVFTDYDHYADIFELKESRILSRQGNKYWVRAVLGLPWPVGDRWVTNETFLSPETFSFSYQRREGTIMRYEGTLKVIPKGPSLCQVVYTAKGDPGINFLPAWLLNRFQAKLLPDSVQRVRNYLAH